MLALLCALAVPLPALSQTAYAGIDSWITPSDGSSFIDFASEPIPAGFFCSGSKSFTGRIHWRGKALATDRQVAPVDTIIERLDDATFNDRGVAVSRLQVRALSLESITPLTNDCGTFDVRATLVGRQPITRIKIFRESEEGGRYLAPLALQVKLTFTPVGGRAGRPLELARQVRLGADPRAVWRYDADAKAARSSQWIQVDTNGDEIPDTRLPRSSNFAAGRSSAKAGRCTIPQECHQDPATSKMHCVQACVYSCNGIWYYCP